MNNIQIFSNPEFGSVRTAVVNNEPWFVAKEIASVLGYKDTADAIKKHVDEEDKKHLDYQTATQLFQGRQNADPEFQGGRNDNLEFKINSFGMYVINESGLYALILNSKLPSAKAFKRWVTSEVLPSLRKTGTYTIPSPAKEITVKEELDFIEASCRILNINEVGRLGMLKEAGKILNLKTVEALPVYTMSNGRLDSATNLLKIHWPEMGVMTFNKLLIAEGLIADLKRKTRTGQKSFKNLTEAGLKWGENCRYPGANMKETQPLYYVDKFSKLVDIIKKAYDNYAVI